MLLRRFRFALFAVSLCACAKQVTITVLATTDLHGNLLPYDYFTAHPAARGLAGIATHIAAARAANPNNLLIDCGDTIQGSPLEYVWQYYVRGGHLPLYLHFDGAPLRGDPMMAAMNALHYDVMTLGNHEFNYGLKNLEAARSQAHFPWLSANTRVDAGAGTQPFAPYLIKEIAGVKIAIIGITTPLIPLWETPEHYRGLTFDDGVTAVRAALADLRAKHHPDLVLVAAHSGLDRDLKTGAVRADDSRENMVYEIAGQVPGIDAIIFGHTHSQLADYRVNGVLLMQPKNWGGSLGRMDFTLDDSSGHWTVASKSSRLIPLNADTPVDPAIAAIAAPYHALAERYLNTLVSESPAALDAAYARVEDTALLDAVQRVQLESAHADVSFASSFNPRARIDKGPVTVRQIAALYVYDNQLYAIEGTGRMVREALENAARYFLACPDESCTHGPLINSQVVGYNYDVAAGVEYEIDLTRPAGDRIRNLRFHGQPLKDDQKLRIAVNNYRAAGSAGYTMFRDAKIVWRSPEEIRDLLIRYYTEHKQFPASPDNNWRIVPEAAREELRRESQAAR
ncbi:MAG: 5'-nucleotidase C-terminal domain-containing protein [Acidobacteriota bacterium]|nr:5'-nucleotidase C-terminal domain-containing protein [Acidobacteriota bacterium]